MNVIQINSILNQSSLKYGCCVKKYIFHNQDNNHKMVIKTNINLYLIKNRILSFRWEMLSLCSDKICLGSFRKNAKSRIRVVESNVR